MRSWAGLALSGFSLLVACNGDDAGGRPTERGLSGELTVSAAASLTESFEELGERFETEHPETSITFNFDSSGALARQIRDGAPADVFAAADEETMAGLVDDGYIDGAPESIAVNALVIVTKPGNPSAVSAPADLPDLPVVARCVHTAPCGKLAVRVLDLSGVDLDPGQVTEAPNVKAALGAVVEGDADAAFVYATDARAAGSSVTTIELEGDALAVTVYPIGVVDATPRGELAAAFVDFVTSSTGRAVLDDHGFRRPPP